MRLDYTPSFSPVDDRFDYARKGIFRCKMKNEFIIVLAVLFVSGSVWLLMLFDVLTTQITMQNALSAPLFEIFMFAGLIAIPFLSIGIVRTVLSGDEYSFTADMTKMLIVCPKRGMRCDVFYSDVIRVDYKEINLFSKLRGYDVTILCRSGDIKFSFLFPYKAYTKNKELTPFRIIEEKAGIITQPEYIAGRRIDDAGIR